MAQQYCQGCGASLMPTLRMCPTCGSKNLDASPPPQPQQITPTATQAANNSSSSATVPDRQLQGLAGWLILVGFGIIISTIKAIALLASLYKPYINSDLLDKITNSNSPTYIPNFVVLFSVETVFNIFIVFASIYLIYLYFTKKKVFPKYFIFINLLTILSVPIDGYLTSIIIPNENILDQETIKSFFQSLVSGAIWIPYMLKSVRVKNTFIED